MIHHVLSFKFTILLKDTPLLQEKLDSKCSETYKYNLKIKTK